MGRGWEFAGLPRKHQMPLALHLSFRALLGASLLQFCIFHLETSLSSGLTLPFFSSGNRLVSPNRKLSPPVISVPCDLCLCTGHPHPVAQDRKSGHPSLSCISSIPKSLSPEVFLTLPLFCITTITICPQGHPVPTRPSPRSLAKLRMPSSSLCPCSSIPATPKSLQTPN